MTSRFFQHFLECTSATQQILLMLYKHPTKTHLLFFRYVNKLHYVP